MTEHLPCTGLTPTAYALLALLARRPWSAYELTKYMQLSALRRIWPRAESRLYEEPKRLVSLGLVQAEEAYQGARKRMVYQITPAGRHALSDWYARPSEPLRYEYESLVKLLNGDHCEGTCLRAVIEEVRCQAKDEARQIQAACEQILEEGWRIPETAEHNGLVVMFMRENIAARLRWCAEAEARLAERLPEAGPQGEARARRWYQMEIEALKRLVQGNE